MAVEKIYESDNFLVINKPFDMYINSDDEKEKNTVTYHIASPDSHLSTSLNPLHFVHRLDYATSGVLFIAKNKKSAAKAGKLFEKRETKKYYLAVLRGHTQFQMADIEYAVGVEASEDCRHKMVAVKSDKIPVIRPRSAHTRILVLETGLYCNEPVTIALLKPITGRRHQLRVHCDAVGHTILGDYTYSSATDTAPHRMYLHATRLILPVENEPLDIRTQEPYFSDTQFTSHWKPLIQFHRYKSKDDFENVCNIIDKSYVIGIKFQVFRCIEKLSET